MSDQVFVETLAITLPFFTIAVVLVLFVLLTERTG